MKPIRQAQDKPTEVRKFWEGCGCEGNVLKYLLNTSLTLDSLFKYAIPKLIRKSFDWTAFNLLVRWVRIVISGKEDPADALFKLLYPIIVKEKDDE